MTYTPDQFAKLPRWAQRVIQNLEADNKDMAERLQEGPEDSRVFADPHSDTARPLGNARIAFRFPKHHGSAVENEITVSITPANRLRVSGSDTLLVLPQSNNSLEIIQCEWSEARALTEQIARDHLLRREALREHERSS